MARLLNSSGAAVAMSTGGCGSCAYLQYNAPSMSSCQAYTLRTGCVKVGTCSGVMTITSTAPLQLPDAPSILPTAFPTFDSSSQVVNTAQCLPYSASSTNWTKSGYIPCELGIVCPGATISISLCNGMLLGDTGQRFGS